MIIITGPSDASPSEALDHILASVKIGQDMAAILGILVFYLVLQALLLTVAVLIGFGLHWCVPDLDISTGILVGMLSSIACAYFLVQLMRAKYVGMLEDYLDDQENEDQEEEPAEVYFTSPPVAERRRRRPKKR